MGERGDRMVMETLVQRCGPVIVMEDVDAAGVSRALIRRALQRGDLRRLAKSAFAPSDVYDGAGQWERFRLRSIGFARTAGEGTYLTGSSAAAVLRIPMLDEPPEMPVAIRPGSAHTGHNLSVYGNVRHGHLPPRHRVVRDGVGTVSPAYCAIDIARHQGPRNGLVATDHALRVGADREVLAQLTDDMSRYPGMTTARWVVEHADGRAESPLETLGRYAFLEAGLPAPLSNVWIPVARRWFRVDLLLPESGVILEGDGAMKYDNRLDASIVVTDDRERERLLRSLAFGVVRFTWKLAVDRPRELVHRARQAARLRGSLLPPTQWTLDRPGWPAITAPACHSLDGRAHQDADFDPVPAENEHFDERSGWK